MNPNEETIYKTEMISSFFAETLFMMMVDESEGDYNKKRNPNEETIYETEMRSSFLLRHFPGQVQYK